MAKVVSGLFSTNPRGSIGGVITYQGRRTYSHAHKKAEHKDRNTAAQIADRVLFTSAVDTWHLLSITDRTLYNSRSSVYNNITGFNIFVSINKGYTIYWSKFGKTLFGATRKFGGPINARLR